MSDAVDKTAAGATRGFLGSLSFILAMLGLEMLTDKSGVQLGLGIFLLILGALAAYAALLWESAKKVLSTEAQNALGRFAQNRVTWFGMIFLVLEALVLSPFVEGHRWPFSYPADSQVYQDKANLERHLDDRNRAIGKEKELADKWRFAKELTDSNTPVCHYQITTTPKARSTQPFWEELLRHAGWIEDGQAPSNYNLVQPGISLRIPSDSSLCASALQRAMTDAGYTNPSTKIVPDQSISCGTNCIIIEMDY